MPSRTLVIRFGSLGDVILASATALNLKLTDPGGEVVFLTKERFRRVAERFDGVDDVVTLDDNASAIDYYRRLVDIDARNFDTVVDLHGNPRSWLARKIVSADHKVIYPKRRIARFQAVARSTHPEHHPHTIDMYNETLRELNRQVYSRRPQIRVSLPPPEIQSFLDVDRPVAVIAPGAAHPPKQWPVEKFARVAEILSVRHDARIVWAVTDADSSRVRLRQQVQSEDLFELINEPIEHLAAIIARASVVVANDSGIAHLSSAVGTPVVAVFGPTHPVLGFSPRGLRDRVIEVEEWCRPCSRHGSRPCFREEQFCFTRISPETVAEAAADIIHTTAIDAPGLFVDRDGTVMVDRDYISNPEEVELIPGAADALKAARKAGYRVVVLSNQSGVARGKFSIESVERVNARLLDLLNVQGATVDGVYYCPYYPGGKVSEFDRTTFLRKPAAGMAEEAALHLGIDLRHSVAIGDKLSDLQLGRVFGGRSFLVRTGYGRQTENELHTLGERFQAFDDLRACIQHLVKQTVGV